MPNDLLSLNTVIGLIHSQGNANAAGMSEDLGLNPSRK